VDYSFKKIFSNTAAQFVVKFTSSLSTLLTSFLITRFLGFGVYGSFTKIVTFVAFFYLLVDAGMNAAFLKDHTSHEKDFANIILLRILFSGMLICIACIIGFLLPYNALTKTGYSDLEKMGILIYSLTIGTYGISLSLMVYLQKKLSYQKSVFPNLVSSAVMIGVLAIGIATHNLFIILIGSVLSGVALCLFLFLNLNRQQVLNKRLTNFIGFSKKLIRNAAPLAALLFLNIVYAKADTIVLSFTKSSADVGVYGFSYRMFEFLIAIPLFFSNSVYPILLANHADSTAFLKLMKQYAFVLFWSAVFMGTLCYIGAPTLSLLYPELGVVVLPFQILVLSLPFFFLTSLFQWVLVIKNKYRLLLGIYGTTMILNIVLNILFIPRYSYVASASITVITEGLVFLIMVSYLVFLRVKNI
jgi:O-antigen/teichoic acid export membrane protein